MGDIFDWCLSWMNFFSNLIFPIFLLTIDKKCFLFEFYNCSISLGFTLSSIKKISLLHQKIESKKNFSKTLFHNKRKLILFQRFQKTEKEKLLSIRCELNLIFSKAVLSVQGLFEFNFTFTVMKRQLISGKVIFVIS